MTVEARRQSMLNEIERVLVQGGFIRLSQPLTVYGVPFDVPRAFVGGAGFLDLVVVLDATEGTPKKLRQAYWLFERIAHALDEAESPRPLTGVILHDADAARVPTEDFLRLGRVLLVSGPASASIELAPILPIVLEPSAEIAMDPLEELASRHSGGQDGPAKRALIEAARSGSDRVQSKVLQWIEAPITGGGISS